MKVLKQRYGSGNASAFSAIKTGLEAAIKLQPRSPVYLANLAALYAQLGEGKLSPHPDSFIRAQELFQLSLKLDPTADAPLFNFATLLDQVRKREQREKKSERRNEH